MNFVWQTPSLGHLVAVKIVADLWNPREIMTLIPRFEKVLPGYRTRDTLIFKDCEAIEGSARSKVLALPLPELLKKWLLDLIKPLGLEIIHWCLYNGGNHYRYLENISPRKFCWTVRGTLDYQQTAKLMVKDERLVVEKRYVLACINCLEEEAKELLSLIVPEYRVHQYANAVRDVLGDRVYYLVEFFTRVINNSGELAFINRLFKHVFFPGESWSDKCLHDTALTRRWMCKYFFSKLNQRDQELVLEDLAEKELRGCEVYLCSLMNEEQRARVLRKRIFGVLERLLWWPNQHMFMEAVRRGWRFMPDSFWNVLLLAIVLKMQRGFRDYDYGQLFWEIWRLTPVGYRRQFLGDITYVNMFFDIEREEFFKLILDEAPVSRLETIFDRMSQVLRVFSDTALVECKETAVKNSSNDKENVEKRLRSEHVSRLVDLVIEERKTRRLL